MQQGTIERIFDLISKAEVRNDKNKNGTWFIRSWIDNNINRLTAFGILLSVGIFIQSMTKPTFIMIILGYCFILLAVVVWLTMDKESILSISSIKDEKEQIKYLSFYIVILISKILLILFAISTIKIEHVGLMTFVYFIFTSNVVIKIVDRLNNKSSNLIITVILILFTIVISIFLIIDYYSMFDYSLVILKILQQ